MESHGDKIRQGRVMVGLIRRLEAAGWRVRRGPWPRDQERWDFLYHRRTLIPLNARAAAAPELTSH
jgi:hypothetical protein